MWFVIFAQDVENSLDLRLQVRPQHLARLTKLEEEGRLLVAGPNPKTDEESPEHIEFTGSTVIAQFESLAAAQTWASNDPYVKAGVYKNVIVKPFKKVLP